jgi:hypothetical protein
MMKETMKSCSPAILPGCLVLRYEAFCLRAAGFLRVFLSAGRGSATRAALIAS